MKETYIEKLKRENPEKYNQYRQKWKVNYWKNKTNPQRRNGVNESRKRYYWRHACLRIAYSIKRKDRTSIITGWDIWKLAKQQKLICALTGRKLSGGNVSPDHIIPLRNGGTSDISNIRLTIKEANIAKHYMSHPDFINLCVDIVKHNSNA
jgi:5-methylcytosine-specific restriction endonuclease McrA